MIYEIVWARSLSLIFGGSHLAVTTVLTVFMAGLALGGWAFGRYGNRVRDPLRLYGWIELGVAASALLFWLLMRAYPVVYPPLARLAETSTAWLTFLRVMFAVGALIAPTTLMGGTLPVMSRLVPARSDRLDRDLGVLYGSNTLGAVAGTLGAGFVLLPALGLSRTTGLAVGTNVLVGLLALALSRAARAKRPTDRPVEEATGRPDGVPVLAALLVLWGAGVSGFCALGYEVLWTRVLGLVVGSSIYGFALMLAAFLTGLALGGHAASGLARISWLVRDADGRRSVLAYGLVQLALSAAALAATSALRDVPLHATRLQNWLGAGDGEFAARQATSFVLAFAFMALPAFLLGSAFPLAAAIHARRRASVGRAVGELLAFNTSGAILGASVSGYALVPLFGIERSLQLLSAINAGLGATVLAAALLPARLRRAGAAAAALASLVLLALLGGTRDWGRTWDRKFFAVFRNNQRAAFDTPERVRDALEHTDVLYYHEGIESTISVIRPRGASQAFLVNGRIEASTRREDVQCQRTLGHLPMLMHPDPRRVFVLGLGTGMTAGAVSLHPQVERITLAEIERGVLRAARTFAEHNHRVLDHPALHIVHDDGRNFLRTTRQLFDVITADPIHPWARGAAYLYTREYFAEAAAHLAAGGVICQWLPIYELTPDDLRAVVRTFAGSFRYTALWLTYYDAELLGSDAPLGLDEERLAERLADPAIAADLAAVDMGTPREFLSYFLLGDAGVRAFAARGAIHSDDNLVLEFSAPRVQGVLDLPGRNVEALVAFRELPARYAVTLGNVAAEARRTEFWERSARAARLYDRAHARALGSGGRSPELSALVARLEGEFPDYAPGRFLAERWREAAAGAPRPIAVERFAVTEARGEPGALEITAVAMEIGRERAVIVFVDNALRQVYAELYVDAPAGELDRRLQAIATRVLGALRAEYARAAAAGTPPRVQLAPRLSRAARAAVE